MKEAKISNYVLIGLSVISIIIIGLFFAVGYDIPYEDDPKYVNPQFTDLLINWNYILAGATILLTLWSVFMQATKGKSSLSEPGLAGKTDIIGIIILVISLGVGFIFASTDTEMLTINNKAWSPAENTTDNMLAVVSIVSILILSIITVLATIASMVAGMLKK